MKKKTRNEAACGIHAALLSAHPPQPSVSFLTLFPPSHFALPPSTVTWRHWMALSMAFGGGDVAALGSFVDMVRGSDVAPLGGVVGVVGGR